MGTCLFIWYGFFRQKQLGNKGIKIQNSSFRNWVLDPVSKILLFQIVRDSEIVKMDKLLRYVCNM